MADVALREQSDVITVPFHGDEILTVAVNGKPHIVIKPAVESIGLDYWTQVEKLRGRSWATTSQRPVVAADGRVRDMLTCDVQTFLMLLATIDERRVGADVRPKLVAYQAEVAQAIEDYWTAGAAVNPRAQEVRTPAEMLLYHAQVAVSHERKINALEGKVVEIDARMDGIEQRTGWYTALGFARLNHLASDHGSVQRLGKRASAIAKRDGITPGKAHNEVYGSVNSYPEACLREAAGLVAA